MPESVAQPLLQRHRNQHLFADHYLDAILPTLPAWRDVLAEAGPVRRQIAERWRQYQPSREEKEAQTEKEWVQPVLDALGHTYEVQPSLAVPGTAQAPDYICYRDAAARQTNKGKLLTEALLAPAGLADLGTPGRGLNQKLTAWWELDFLAFRAEVRKVFRHDIPLKERDEWAAWLAEQRAQHETHTTEIIRLEMALNERVYALFDLTPAEIKIVAESTAYRYGEV